MFLNVTFTGLQKTLQLGSMEMRSESTVDLCIFFLVLNEMLQEYTGKEDYKFNPVSFICDHAGANYRAIEVAFGAQVAKTRVVSTSSVKCIT